MVGSPAAIIGPFGAQIFTFLSRGLVRIIDEPGEDYLFGRAQCAFVDLLQATRTKILVFQPAS
jgi:hypothetical protein